MRRLAFALAALFVSSEAGSQSDKAAQLTRAAVECSNATAVKYALSTQETARAILDAAVLKCQSQWNAAVQQATSEWPGMDAKSRAGYEGAIKYLTTLDAVDKALRNAWEREATILIFDARANPAGK